MLDSAHDPVLDEQFIGNDPALALTRQAYGYVGENPLNGRVGENPLNGRDPAGLFGKRPESTTWLLALYRCLDMDSEPAIAVTRHTTQGLPFRDRHHGLGNRSALAKRRTPTR